MAVAHRIGVDPIVEEARDRWNQCDEAESSQRESILAAKKFRAGDQWDPAIKQARAGKTALQGLAAQPPRPCLTIDRLSQPVRQVSNQIRTAQFAIDVVPAGHGADDATAEIIKGYLRRVQNLARDDSPIEWAADGAIEGGIGWFRIRTEYVQEGPPDPQHVDESLFDQELRLERITNNLTVYCDPYAQKPTRSDARYMFVTEDLDREEFQRRYPKADMAGLEDFASTGDDTRGWVTKDTIRIAEYWRVEHVDEHWQLDPATRMIVPVKKFDETVPQRFRRVVKRPVVQGFKINAVEILEKWDWLGSRIPLIPILGEELNVDGKAWLRGLVQEGMDAQRMINFMYSGAVEQFALMPRAPILAATGAVDAYKDLYQTLNSYNYSWAPWDAFDAQGRPMPPPQPLQRDAAPLQAAVELMRVSEEALKATTGIYSEFLGQSDPQHRSGRAIQALQGQSDLNNSNYGANVSRALVYAGQLMVEIMPKITRPGQILHILGMDDEPEQVMVGQPFTMGQGGIPQAVPQAPPGMPPGPPQMAQGPQGMPSQGQGVPPEMQRLQQGEQQFYDLTRGTYAVVVTVGKAAATKREEGAAALSDLIPHLPPEMAAAATPDFVEQLSFPGAHKIAEKLRKALPPGLRDEEEGGPDPEKMQMQQQIQQLQQALESKKAEEMAKQQAQTERELAKAKMDAESRERVAQIQADTTADRELALQVMKNATTIAVAHINAAAKGADLHAHAAEEAAAMGHEAALDQVNREHEAEQAELDRRHDQDLADQAHAQALEQGEQAHGQALEQSEQAAALAPQPEPAES